MSFDIFLKKNVTVAIYEVGVGGENDATNVIETPVVTGITSLGIDHEKTLRVPRQIRPIYFALEAKYGQEDGATIEEIAWHKAGIFKSGCPAFSILQQSHAANTLRHRAEEKGVSLTFIESLSELLDVKFPVGIQRKNAALAVALTNTFLNRDAGITCVDYSRISEEVLRGLGNANLRGRCQLLKEGPYFVNRNSDPAAAQSLYTQKHYSALWQSLDPHCHVAIAPTVENAINLAREFGKQGMQTLVTGSFHLVGGVLFILEPEMFN
ncbi:MAG: hypothetical protein Q9163_000871 [Psora crenata]